MVRKIVLTTVVLAVPLGGVAVLVFGLVQVLRSQNYGDRLRSSLRQRFHANGVAATARSGRPH